MIPARPWAELNKSRGSFYLSMQLKCPKVRQLESVCRSQHTRRDRRKAAVRRVAPEQLAYPLNPLAFDFRHLKNAFSNLQYCSFADPTFISAFRDASCPKHDPLLQLQALIPRACQDPIKCVIVYINITEKTLIFQ